MIKEGRLRTILTDAMRGASSSDLGALNSVIAATYDGLITPSITRERLVETTLRAARSNRWTGSMSKIDGDDLKGRVGIGYYQSESYYFTHFLHELCHNLVEQLGRPSSYFDSYYVMANEEELMCWEFADVASQLMILPFDKHIQDVSSRYWTISQALLSDISAQDQDVFFDALVSLGKLEKEIYGFSMTLGDEFYWREEQPVLKI